MSFTPVTYGGTTYQIPALGDSGWATGPGNLTQYLIALAGGSLTHFGQNRTTYAAGTASGSYTGSLTLVNLPTATPYVQTGANLQVYRNGVLCAPSLDYAETSPTSFTFNAPLTTGDRIDALWINP